MKLSIKQIAPLALALMLCGFNWYPSNLSSLASPRAIGNPVAVPGDCSIYVNVNSSSSRAMGVVHAHVGNRLDFGTQGDGAEPSTITVNGTLQSWIGSDTRVAGYKADVTGEWDFSFTSPGCTVVETLYLIVQ